MRPVPKTKKCIKHEKMDKIEVIALDIIYLIIYHMSVNGLKNNSFLTIHRRDLMKGVKKWEKKLVRKKELKLRK